MERQRYRELKSVLRQAALGHHDDPRCIHHDATIVAVLLWAAIHHKPIAWAANPAHWPGDLRPRPLPSQSCLSRRLRHERVVWLLQRLQDVLRARLPRNDVKLIDARPLPVGGCSKDPDARTGYGARHRQKGYKLHMICDVSGAVDHWLVTPMNGSEPDAAHRMIDHCRGAAYIVGDGNYDANRLYDQAGEHGTQWVALPRRRKSRAPGHRRHSPHRLRVWSWVRSRQGGRIVRRIRGGIERINAWQGCAAIGLHHLPHHVRREHRVRVWVAAKLILYHHWLEQRTYTQHAA